MVSILDVRLVPSRRRQAHSFIVQSPGSCEQQNTSSLLSCWCESADKVILPLILAGGHNPRNKRQSNVQVAARRMPTAAAASRVVSSMMEELGKSRMASTNTSTHTGPFSHSQRQARRLPRWEEPISFWQDLRKACTASSSKSHASTQGDCSGSRVDKGWVLFGRGWIDGRGLTQSQQLSKLSCKPARDLSNRTGISYRLLVCR